MKILLTGGGTGGHFYPLIAVAQAINEEVREKKLLAPQIYYLSTDPYNEELLFENNIIFKQISAGKMRRYFSILNFFDLFKTGWGILKAMWEVFLIYPDVIFSKGGYVSFPVVIAARFFNIPLVIHESDSVPGKVNKWSASFAKKIAISFPESVNFFPKEKVALTGNPIRKELITPLRSGAYEFLQLEEKIPVILVIGGSQGAKIINDNLVDMLPKLVEKYQIIHQTGVKNLEENTKRSSVVLEDNIHKNRYKIFGNLDTLALRMAAGAADIIISRAGSAIFEIASWGVPSIIIPITDSAEDHQKTNAYTYARSGACVVIEEKNLTPNLLFSEVDKIINSKEEQEIMKKGAKDFAVIDGAKKIANEIINIALQHEE